MAIEAISNIRANVEGGDSVKSLREELKQAKDEAINLARQFGEFSPEAVQATKRVAELRDQMDDFNDRLQAVHPDKFAAIGSIASNVAKGFAGAQGAMALFGSESENVQKQLLKIQGAMAFAEGLETVGALKQQFGALAGTLKEKVLTAFTTVGGAARALGGALGIGLIVTVVTTLINNFDKLKKGVSNLIDRFPVLGKVINAVTDTVKGIYNWFIKLTDAIGLTNSALDAQKEKWEANNKAADDYIEILEASGASEEKIYYAKKKRLLDEIEQLKKSGEDKEKLAEVEQQLRVLYASNAKRVRDEQTKQEAEADKERQKNHEAYLKRLEEQAAADKKRQEEEAAAAKKKLEDYQQLIQDIAQIEAEANQKAFEEKQKNDDIERQNTEKNRLAIEESLKKKEEDAARYAEATVKNQESVYNSAQSIASSLSDLAGRQSKIGKGIALAQIAADTARALTAALANANSPTPDNVASGGLAGLAKYAVLAANIFANAAKAKQILSGGGGSNASIASPAASQPFNVGVTQLRTPQQAQNYGNNRVYVLESDITKTQGRVQVNRQVSVF